MQVGLGLFLALSFLVAAVPARAQSSGVSGGNGLRTESDDPDFVRASLLVASPGDSLYSLVGHCALRMECPTHGLDYCFSYEAEPAKKKVLAYLSGLLHMGMFAVPTEKYISFYEEEGRGVTQYRLNLPLETKRKVWEKLDGKAAEGVNLPYDCLSRGCALSIFSLLLDSMAETEVNPRMPIWPEKYNRTRREIIHDALSDSPWNQFTLWALVGSEADRKVPNRDKVVLPQDLVDMLGRIRIDDKRIIDDSGTELRPTNFRWDPPSAVTPTGLAWAFVALAVVNAIRFRYTIAIPLMAVYALAGLFFAYLVFVSALPATGWNWLLVPFNPLPVALYKWRRYWGRAFAAVIAVWTLAILISPHRLADPPWILFAVAYAIFFAFIHRKPRSVTPSGTRHFFHFA